MTDLAAIVSEMREAADEPSALSIGHTRLQNRVYLWVEKLEALHSQANERDGCIRGVVTGFLPRCRAIEVQCDTAIPAGWTAKTTYVLIAAAPTGGSEP